MTHSPTSSGPPHHTPTTCWCCGRRAFGIGIGEFGRRGDGDPKFLCEACIPLIEHIKAVVRFDEYEQNAIHATIEAVGPLIEKFGTDLAEWDADQVEEFVTAIILGFGHSIREQVREREIPF